MRERWIEITTKIGMVFLDIWNKKKLILPLLLTISLACWAVHYMFPNLITLHLALFPTIILLMILFIGTIVIEHLETTGDFQEVPSLVTQTLIATGIILAILGYLSGMLFGILPAPPLPIMFAILFAIPVAPLVTLLVLLPPLIGYIPKLRPRWVNLRKRVPFWAVYLGFIAGFLTLAPLFLFPTLFQTDAAFRIMLMGGVLMFFSLVLASLPYRVVCRPVGLLMAFFGILTWLGASGGLTLGSVLAVIGGGYAFDWEPKVHPLQLRGAKFFRKLVRG